jgi:ATP-dependent protease ClpP protease subunit
MSRKNLLIEYKVAPELLDAVEILRRGEYKVVMVHGSFSQERANKFEEDFHIATLTGQPVIPILISSYGGSVDQLNRMIDLIETAPVPVATIARGMCMSCGSFLLASGTEGYTWASKSTNIMIHDLSAGDFNKAEDVLNDARALKRWKETVFYRLDEQTHKAKGYWMDTLKGKGNTDYYLSAGQAKRLKVIDHVGIPKLTVDISVTTKFE